MVLRYRRLRNRRGAESVYLQFLTPWFFHFADWVVFDHSDVELASWEVRESSKRKNHPDFHRYRSTASFVHGLLREGFKTPHTRFNAYIRASTGFEPLDAMEEVEAEGRGHDTSWEVGYHRLDFSSLPTG